MTDINLAATAACLICAALISLQAELLRPRMGAFADSPVQVRFAMHVLSVLFVGRAWRIHAGYGQADPGEVLVYFGMAFTILLQLGASVKRAWRRRLAESKVEVIPELKQAVKEAASEAIPPHLQDLARPPADYEHGVRLYPTGELTPVDPELRR